MSEVDRKRYPVLFVDDEEAVLRTIEYAFGERYSILTAGSGEEALRLLAAREDIAILVSDHRMAGLTGVELCERAVTLRPRTFRFLMSAYADLQVAIDAINRGKVHRLLAKPIRHDEIGLLLETTIQRIHHEGIEAAVDAEVLWEGQAALARIVQAEIGHEIDRVVGAAFDAVEELERHCAGLPAAADPLEDLSAVVDQLGAIARRLEAGPHELAAPGATCDAADAVEASLRIVRRELAPVADVRVSIERPLVVRAERSMVGQVMINLLHNAVDALRAAGTPREALDVVARREDDVVLIEVRDRGPGVPAELRSSLFRPGITTKEGHAGMGLALVKRYLEEIGGTIELQDADPGARFIVRLPAG